MKYKEFLLEATKIDNEERLKKEFDIEVRKKYYKVPKKDIKHMYSDIKKEFMNKNSSYYVEYMKIEMNKIAKKYYLVD